jgi:hypothetical protein
MPRKPTAVEVGLAKGFRSGLEDVIAAQLTAAGVDFGYETLRLSYAPSPKPRHYTPDFILPNGIVIESKGRFDTPDRGKHKLVKAQHPDLDIRFVFSNSRTRISKQSLTTYGVWAASHGFLYADRLIPMAWINEPANPKSLAAIARVMENK